MNERQRQTKKKKKLAKWETLTQVLRMDFGTSFGFTKRIIPEDVQVKPEGAYAACHHCTVWYSLSETILSGKKALVERT